MLFVDDEERIVNLLRMMFRAEYDVHTATSGAAALEIVAKHPIDVIVSDQRMPQMLGIQLLNEVRQRSPATMRVLLTGYSDLSAIVGSVNEGEVFRFVNKPWNHSELKLVVAQAAEAASATSRVLQSSMAINDDQMEPVGLLIVDDCAEDRNAMCSFFKPTYDTHGAASVRGALAVLGERDIGVVIIEAMVGGEATGQFLRLLKQHYPTVTTVVLTRSTDADMVVRLINGAQIFRFAAKPIRVSVLQLAVQAATKEHRRLLAHPALSQRYQTGQVDEPENASLLEGVRESLVRWRSRFKQAFS